MAHLFPVVTALLSEIEQPHHISFQSDSPVNQYRGKEMFYLLANVFPMLFPTVQSLTWNFTEAGHGKGPVDGVGAAVKSNANSVVKHGKDVDTFQKFVECSTKLENVKVMVVTEEDITAMKSHIVRPVSFRGTQQVHQLTWSREHSQILFFNYLSCFDCPPGSRCSHFYLGTLDFTPQEVPNEELTVEDGSNDGEDFNNETLNTHQPAPARKEDSTIKFKKNDWVTITLSERQYPGKVSSVRGDSIYVRVLMRDHHEVHGEVFIFPIKPDVRKVNINAVSKINHPPSEVAPLVFKIFIV